MYYDRGVVYYTTTDTSGTIKNISTRSYDGIYFQPKFLRFVSYGFGGYGMNASTKWSTLSAGFATPSSQMCVNAGKADTFNRHVLNSLSATSCIQILGYNTFNIDFSWAIMFRIALNSIYSTGFTLFAHSNFGTHPFPIGGYPIFWEAWGGDDITDVTIGSGGYTTNQNLICNGFISNAFNSPQETRQDQCIMTIELANNYSNMAPESLIITYNQYRDPFALNFGYSISPSGSPSKSFCIVNYNRGGDSVGYDVCGAFISGGIMQGLMNTDVSILSTTGVTELKTSGYLNYYTTNRSNASVFLGGTTNNTNGALLYASIKGGSWDIGYFEANTQQINTLTNKTNFEIIGGHLCSTGSGVGGFNSGVLSHGFFKKQSNNLVDCASFVNVYCHRSTGSLSLNPPRHSGIISYSRFEGASSVTGDIHGASWSIDSLVDNQLTMTNTSGARNATNERVYYLVFGNDNLKTPTSSVGHPFIS